MPEPELFDAEAMRFVARRDDTAELSQPPLAPDAQASAPLTVLIVGTASGCVSSIAPRRRYNTGRPPVTATRAPEM